MQVVARPLAPGEPDYELIGFAASVTGFGLAASWFALHLPWPICFFHALTGAPCLTCGATRSAMALFHGELSKALHWNPLACLAYCGIALFNFYALTALTMRTRRLRGYFNTGEQRILRLLAVA